MGRPAVRAPDPSDTVVERTVISVLHDIALAVLVTAQITVAVVFRLLNLLINIGPILNHMAPTLVLRNITRTLKSIIMILTRPFVVFFRSIDAFCTAVYTDPSSNTYFICSGGLLFVTTWLCSGIGWERFYPIVSMLFEVVVLLWLVVSVWGAVAFLRHRWRSWGGTGRQQKRKSKPSVQKDLTASKHLKDKGPPRPEPLDLSFSFHARDYLDLDDDPNRNWSNEHGNLSPKEAKPISPLRRWFAGIIEDLDDDSNRNWSDEHGNLSPEPVRSSKPRSDDTRNRLAKSKTLDDDNNRNWSNEHGNLSPESLGRGYGDDILGSGTKSSSSSTATITTSSSASASSGHKKLNITSAAISTFASRDARIFTPTTASTSGSILTPSSALETGHFRYPDYLGVDDCVRYLRSLAQNSPTSSGTGSDNTAIYTPATTGSVVSSSHSTTDGVMYTPNSTNTSGAEAIHTPASANILSDLAERQLTELSRPSASTKRDNSTLFPDPKRTHRP